MYGLDMLILPGGGLRLKIPHLGRLLHVAGDHPKAVQNGSIAEDRAHILHQKSASENSNAIKGLGLMRIFF
jgi:hypothetical protein